MMNFKFGRKYNLEYFHGGAGSVGHIGLTGQSGIIGHEGFVDNNPIIDPSGHQGMSNEIDTPFENHNSHFITIMNRLIESHETNF